MCCTAGPAAATATAAGLVSLSLSAADMAAVSSSDELLYANELGLFLVAEEDEGRIFCKGGREMLLLVRAK